MLFYKILAAIAGHATRIVLDKSPGVFQERERKRERERERERENGMGHSGDKTGGLLSV